MQGVRVLRASGSASCFGGGISRDSRGMGGDDGDGGKGGRRRRGWLKKGRREDGRDGDSADSRDGVGDGGESGKGKGGLAGLFGKDEDARKRGENMRSVKRRIVGIRRQEDDAPVRVEIGFRSRTGWEMIRGAKHNQDCVIVLCPWGPGSRYSLFAILDGHGRNGHLVSLFVAQKVVDLLPQLLKTCASEDLALKKALKFAERCLGEESSIDSELSGSTAVFCLIAGNRLFCANVGDSRAVLARKLPKGIDGETGRSQEVALVQRNSITEAIVQAAKSHDSNTGKDYDVVLLSYDHNPTRADEKDRVVKAGGRVDCWASIDVGDERVWLPDVRIPGLAVTRSFGDQIVKKFAVHARPEITQLSLSKYESFVILASDGLWDYVSNEEAVEFVAKRRKSQSAQAVAEALVKKATEQWIEKDDVIDDISIIIVYMEVDDSSVQPHHPHVVSVS